MIFHTLFVQDIMYLYKLIQSPLILVMDDCFQVGFKSLVFIIKIFT